MLIELGKIVNAEKSIMKLQKQGGAIPAKFQYRLSFLIKELHAYNEIKNGLIKELGEKDKAGNYFAKGTALNKINEQLSEMKKEKIEVRFLLLDVKELLKKKDDDGEPATKLDAEDWIALECFIDGEPEFEEI